MVIGKALLGGLDGRPKASRIVDGGQYRSKGGRHSSYITAPVEDLAIRNSSITPAVSTITNGSECRI